MIDFLRSNPWCSQEEYKWQMTIPQIKLSSFDFSHVETLDKPEGHTFNIDSVEDVKSMSDLGFPVFGT